MKDKVKFAEECSVSFPNDVKGLKSLMEVKIKDKKTDEDDEISNSSDEEEDDSENYEDFEDSDADASTQTHDRGRRKINRDVSTDRYLYDDITSEVDNFMDSLSTVDPEIETDMENRHENDDHFCNIEKNREDSDAYEERRKPQAQISNLHPIGSSLAVDDGNDSFKNERFNLSYCSPQNNLTKYVPSDGDAAAEVHPSNILDLDYDKKYDDDSSREMLLTNDSEGGACKMFAEIPERESSLVISAGGMEIELKRAFEIFSKMKTGRLKPEGVNDLKHGHAIMYHINSMRTKAFSSSNGHSFYVQSSYNQRIGRMSHTIHHIKASPILGFFFAGVVLNQFGLIRNLTDVKVLSEWGILFLLFEMGLELPFARLKALAKFAFGMGLSQVLSMLPPFKGKSVLELGAGIGRFTGEFAKEAGQVIALDFIENVIKKNEAINGHFENVKFMCADVTSPELQISSESVDLIFSNWLLMYLSDNEVEKLVERMVKWLKVGGFIFFRESCFHQSGDCKRRNNPTHYREPRFYTKVFKECQAHDGSGNSFELSLISCKCIGAYVRNKKNQNQICWLFQKVSSDSDKGFQRFLDNVQYKCNGILRYERVFGEGYVSTGGIETTKEFVEKLELKPGQKVLDVGCGIGGGDFYMAENFDAEVVGIDLSVNMISFALERAIGRKCSVEFEVADCTKKTYPDETFDVIYSRDTILHIQDKPALFKNFFKWLKPGGKVLISDYCKSPGPPSVEFGEYIKQRGYDLHDVEAYGQMLTDAGFDDVIAEDRTEQFIKVLQRELDAVEKDKVEFVADFSEEDYNDIVGGWKAKLTRTASGEQRWGLFIAKKEMK